MLLKCSVFLFMLHFFTVNGFIDCPVVADYVDIPRDFDIIVKKMIRVDSKKNMVFDEDIELKKSVFLVLKPKEEFAFRSLKITASQASKVVVAIKSRNTDTTREKLLFSEETPPSATYEVFGDAIQHVTAIQIKIVAKKKRNPFIIHSIQITGCHATPIMCPELSQLKHGLTVTESREPGGKTMYYCKSTHELVGNKVTICQITGVWSSPMPYCKELVHCDRPTHPKNGVVFVNRHHEGATVHYKCDSGFVLKGPQKRFCQSNGQWDRHAPTCEPK